MKKNRERPFWLRFPKSWKQYPRDWKERVKGLNLSDANVPELPTLTNKQLHDPALTAVWQADITHNPGPIIDFLLKNKPSPWGRKLIVDWRRRNTQGAPAKKKPIYVEYTMVELTYKLALWQVDKLVRNGMSRTDAIKDRADYYGIPVNALAGAARRGRE